MHYLVLVVPAFLCLGTRYQVLSSTFVLRRRRRRDSGERTLETFLALPSPLWRSLLCDFDPPLSLPALLGQTKPCACARLRVFLCLTHRNDRPPRLPTTFFSVSATSGFCGHNPVSSRPRRFNSRGRSHISPGSACREPVPLPTHFARFFCRARWQVLVLGDCYRPTKRRTSTNPQRAAEPEFPSDRPTPLGHLS